MQATVVVVLGAAALVVGLLVDWVGGAATCADWRL